MTTQSLFSRAWKQFEKESCSQVVESLSSSTHVELCLTLSSRQTRTVTRLIRITPHTQPTCLDFMEFVANDSETYTGLVRMTAPPIHLIVPSIANDTRSVLFVAEQYEEIVHDSVTNKRMDLLEYYNQFGANQQFWVYMEQVIETIKRMHRNGFVHMDVSLENVMLTPSHAFLIDYESVLQFHPARPTYVQRQVLNGHPIKPLYAPIEHSTCVPTDYVDLVSYDIYAIGVMIFVGAYGEYPDVKVLPIDQRKYGKFQIEVLRDIFVCPDQRPVSGGSLRWENERPSVDMILGHRMWTLLVGKVMTKLPPFVVEKGVDEEEKALH